MSEPNQSLEEFLFEAALRKSSAAERAAFLDGVCRENPTLRARLDTLLEGHFQAEGFLADTAKKVDTKPAESPSDADIPSERIGRYKLLQPLGEGGCGIVYMAEQQEPVRRTVALKVIKLGMDTKQVIARFEAERQALALMDHPNIAKVFDAGTTGTGRPYFVMELVKGIPITRFCDENTLTAEQRLRLFMQVCQAVQHAHQKGVIHRDLKPSNILVADNGTPVPKIIDFGIAKATADQRLTDKTLFTALEQFIGTPAYMSPEQAKLSGLDVDTRSDIYSLGVLLYEILTGKTPFDPKRLLEAGLDEIRRTIQEEEPLRPSTRLGAMTKEELTTTAQRRGAEPPKLLSLVRGDLDWIVMKCLEKDRARRYETANGLANDIARHLNNEPVVASPPGRLYRFQKLVRRNLMAATAVAVIALVLVLGLCASTSEAVRARRAEQEQTAQRQRAEASERLRERVFYTDKMNMAQVAWEQNRVAQLRQLLEETATYPDRGFEWYYWQRQTHLELKTLRGHSDYVDGVVWSPDGQRIVTGSLDTTAKVWDAASFKELFSLKFHLHTVSCLAFSRDSGRIVTGGPDAIARIWDIASGKDVCTLEGHNGQITSVDFSPDGSKVVTGSWDQTARVWDAATGHELFRLDGRYGRVQSAAFSPDGKRIVTANDDQRAVIWDVASRKELLSIPAHGGVVWDALYSPDGKRIITCGDEREPIAKVWDAISGSHLFDLAGHIGRIDDIRFSRDGRRIATASEDRTAKVWEAATGQLLFTIKGPSGPLTGIDFSADGQRLVTSSMDGTAKIWDATGDREVLTLKGHSMIGWVAFSPNGDRIVTASFDAPTRIWDAADGNFLGELRGQSGSAPCVAFSRDGRRIATCDNQVARIWDTENRQLLLTLEGHKGNVTRLAFSPDGKWIITGDSDHIVRLWEAATGKQRITLPDQTEGISALAFSPDSQRFATASADGTGKVWDLATTNLVCILRGHEGVIPSIAFSPDGQRILTASADHTARLWDANTGTNILVLKGHGDEVRSAAFSPDGRRILTGSSDQTAKLWDADTGQELLTLKGHQDRIHSVAFSPDGRRILTGSQDRSAKVWEAATPDQVAAWQTDEKQAAEQKAALNRQRAADDEKTRLSTAQDSGAIKQWLVLGPLTFEGANGTDALAKEQIVGENRFRPSDGQLVGTNGWAWQAKKLDDYRISFFRLFRSKAPSRLAYLVSYIESKADQAGLLMKVGSESQSKVYLNGNEIYRHDKARKFVPDQDVVTNVRLIAGLNVVVFKVVDEDDDWRASLRLCDASGQPLKGIRVTLDPGK